MQLSEHAGTPTFKISVQTEDFSLADEYQLLAATPGCGAVLTFCGLVRDDGTTPLQALELEHYPGMTEQALTGIALLAIARFKVNAVTLIHRIGTLTPQQQIVLVGVASSHRSEAFQACEFIMDYLKTKAPLWKKQHLATGSDWVEANSTDDERAKRWQLI
jgi:molybdopterin synthase catalytic subunit